MGQAMQAMHDLGDLDQLEHLLQNATNPGALAEADIDRVRDLLGDDAAQSLERLESAHQDARGGRPDREQGGPPRTDRPRACGRSVRTRCATCSPSSRRNTSASTSSTSSGRATSGPTRPSRTSTATRSSSTCTARSATRIAATGSGTPVRLHPDDFEIERTEHLTRSSTVLMLDLSMSMPMRDNFLPAKKVAMALHHLISTQFPRDYLGLVGFSETARVITRRAAARGVVGLRLRHQHAPRVHARPATARQARPAASRSS